MKRLAKDKKLWLQVGLLILSALIIFMYLNDPQCPSSFTQEQVDEAGCTVGANIGLGLALIFIAPAFIASLAFAIHSAWRRTKK